MAELLVLFEDEAAGRFVPLSYTRPLYDMRCGVFTLRERVALLSGSEPAGICRAHLAAVHGAGRWPLGLLASGAPLVLVNGRALDLAWLPALRAAPPNTVFVTDAGGVEIMLGARLTPALASAIFAALLEQQGAAALHELRRFARVVDVATTVLTNPWDLIVANGAQIVGDVAVWREHGLWPSAAEQRPTHDGVVLRAPERIHIHPAARLDGPLVLDARDGPIVIDAAHIEPFSVISGPCAIGPGTIVASARIRGETTLGPVCRIGGEVEASIVQGYSNKHHDGFLGHAYLGEWVNIGAMTTNSDLKNTYGTIRVALGGAGQVDSGVLKLGCFLADHVKLGIGVHLNGGAMIGTGSNIFGVHFAPKTIPPFTWGGEVFREYRIDAMVDVTRRVMARRKQTLSAPLEAILREVFVMTRGDRARLATDARPAVSLESGG